MPYFGSYALLIWQLRTKTEKLLDTLGVDLLETSEEDVDTLDVDLLDTLDLDLLETLECW